MILLRNYWLVYNLYDCQTAHFRPIGLRCSVPESQQSDSNVIITDCDSDDSITAPSLPRSVSSSLVEL